MTAEHECGACSARARASAERSGEDMTKWKPPVYTFVYLDPRNTIGDLEPLQLVPVPPPADD